MLLGQISKVSSSQHWPAVRFKRIPADLLKYKISWTACFGITPLLASCLVFGVCHLPLFWPCFFGRDIYKLLLSMGNHPEHNHSPYGPLLHTVLRIFELDCDGWYTNIVSKQGTRFRFDHHFQSVNISDHPMLHEQSLAYCVREMIACGLDSSSPNDSGMALDFARRQRKIRASLLLHAEGCTADLGGVLDSTDPDLIDAQAVQRLQHKSDMVECEPDPNGARQVDCVNSWCHVVLAIKSASQANQANKHITAESPNPPTNDDAISQFFDSLTLRLECEHGLVSGGLYWIGETRKYTRREKIHVDFPF